VDQGNTDFEQEMLAFPSKGIFNKFLFYVFSFNSGDNLELKMLFIPFWEIEFLGDLINFIDIAEPLMYTY
jgi:hypothetical protein